MFNAFLRASLLTHHQVYAFFSSFSKSALSSSFPHECAVAAQGTPIAGFASGVGAQGGTFHDSTQGDGKGPHGLVVCRL